MALGRATKITITALYISDSGARGSERPDATHHQGQAILKEVVTLAERYSTEMSTAVPADDIA